MTLGLLRLSMGAVTYAIRLSMIALFGRIEIPRVVRDGLVTVQALRSVRTGRRRRVGGEGRLNAYLWTIIAGMAVMWGAGWMAARFWITSIAL